jgi:thioredoxin-like negative regulator of GroEL
VKADLLAVALQCSGSFRCSLVKCDLTESPALVEQFRIVAVPTFLMCVLHEPRGVYRI